MRANLQRIFVCLDDETSKSGARVMQSAFWRSSPQKNLAKVVRLDCASSSRTNAPSLPTRRDERQPH